MQTTSFPHEISAHESRMFLMWTILQMEIVTLKKSESGSVGDGATRSAIGEFCGCGV